MTDERLRILKLLEEHKITAAEAERLLAALGEPDRPAGRQIRIRVRDLETGARNVDLTVPLAVARWGMQFAPAEVLEREGIDPDVIRQALDGGLTGKVVDIEKDGKAIEVTID